MPRTYSELLPSWLPRLSLAMVLPLALFLATTWPAKALGVSEVNRFFEGHEGILIVHGAVPDRQVIYIDEPEILDDSGVEGDRIRIVMQTRPSLSEHEVGFEVRIPVLKPGTSLLQIVGKDMTTGFETELYSRYLLPEPLFELTLDKNRILSTEKLGLRVRFLSSAGYLPGTAQVVGDKVRVPLVIGCYYCPIPFPGAAYDLHAEIGPLPPGEFTVEVYGDDPDGEQPEIVFASRKLLVLPDPVMLQGDRFAVEIPLDPPHSGSARLVGLPSEDSALFYFFSPDNWEAMVKVLDGCAINGFYWVFGAASTDVGYVVKVHDFETGALRQYPHPAGTPAPAITDIAAFPCATALQGGSK